MKLSHKFLLTLSISLSIYWASHYWVDRTIVLPNFHAQEQQQAQQHIQHVLGLINFTTEALTTFCLDWASWDDTYAFVAGENSAAYIDSNLGDGTFIDNNLHLICYLDNGRHVVWEGTRDQHRFPSLQNNWHKNVQLKKDGSANGFYMTSSGPAVLAVKPITDSDRLLPPRGFLVMGRLLHQETLSGLSHYVHGTVRLLPLTPGNELTATQIHTLISNTTPLIIPSDLAIHIYTIISSPDGKPAFIVTLAVDRSVVPSSESTLQVDALSNILSGLITALIFFLFFRHNVTHPLSQLTAHVSNINTTKDLSTISLGTPRNDEIGTLWLGFNHMVQRLQKNHATMELAQQSLQAEKIKIAAILDTAPDGIITVFQDGTIESLNRTAAQMFGYTIDELKGNSIELLAQKEHAEILLQTLRIFPESDHRKCFKTGCEMAGRRKDNEFIPVHMRASSLAIDDQILFVWVIRDISALKAMNEKIAHTKRLAVIGEMGASIAHEIRNPLAGISAATQMLRKATQDTPQHTAVLNEIIVQVFRIENTVDQMLNYSRAWTPTRQDTPPMPLLDQIATEISANKKFHHITFTSKSYDHDSLPIDPDLIRQVVINIFNNAADAMPDGGEICYGIVAGTHYANISIKDTGKGMTEEILSKLFTPFFTTKTYGTGLGLAICQRIIEAHCGSIMVRSVVNEGTEVILRLPLTHDFCPDNDDKHDCAPCC